MKPEFIKLYTIDASSSSLEEFLYPVLPAAWKHIDGNYVAHISIDALIGFQNVRYISLCKGIEFMKEAVLAGDTLSEAVIAGFA